MVDRSSLRPLIDIGDDDILFVPSQYDHVFAAIDRELGEVVERYNWTVNKDGYFWTNPMIDGHHKRIFLHHVVAGYPLHGMKVDHIYQNRTDNRLSELRIVSNRGNGANRRRGNATGFAGVYASGNAFLSQIQVDGKRVYLGTRSAPEECARLYDAAVILLGEDVELANNTDPTPDDFRAVEGVLIARTFRSERLRDRWTSTLKSS